MMAIPAVIAEGEEGGLEAKGKKVADPSQNYFHYTIYGFQRSTIFKRNTDLRLS
jgi:hypothetical protein